MAKKTLFKLLFVFLLIALTNDLQAQKFKTDRYGYVADPAFHELIKQRNYQIVSAFDTVIVEQQPKILATVFKANVAFHIDLEGQEFPYYNEIPAMIKAREQALRKPYEDAKMKFHALTRADPRYEKVKTGDLYGLIRKSDGKAILKTEYQSLDVSLANFIIIKQNGQYGAADTLGNVFIKPAYDIVDPCMADSSGINFFIALKDGKFTLVDRKGKALFPPKYQKIDPFAVYDVLFTINSVKGELRWGLISKTGKILFEPQYTEMVKVEGMDFIKAYVPETQKFGLVNSRGEVILEPVYDRVETSSETGYMYLEKGGKTGLMDKNGKILVGSLYDKLWVEPANGLIGVGNKQSGSASGKYQYGLLNYQNKLVVPLSYDKLSQIGEFYLGQKGGSYYLLNKNGQVLRHYEYTYMNDSNGYLIAFDKNKCYGVIDVKGKIVVPFKYSNLRGIGGHYFATPEGIYDPEGRQVLNGDYTRSTFTNNLKLRAKGVFLFTGFDKESFSDRYGNQFDPKRPVQ